MGKKLKEKELKGPSGKHKELMEIVVAGVGGERIKKTTLYSTESSEKATVVVQLKDGRRLKISIDDERVIEAEHIRETSPDIDKKNIELTELLNEILEARIDIRDDVLSL